MVIGGGARHDSGFGSNTLVDHRLEVRGSNMARTRKHRRAGVPPEGDQARYVYTEQPRCPACAKTYPHLTVYGHARKASGDGSISRYVRCACGQRFIHVAE